jgi:hypothetical protein
MSITLHVKAADLIMSGAKVNFERRSDDDIDHYAIALVVFPSGLELGFDCADNPMTLYVDVKSPSKRHTYIDELCDLGVPFTVS